MVAVLPDDKGPLHCHIYYTLLTFSYFPIFHSNFAMKASSGYQECLLSPSITS